MRPEGKIKIRVNIKTTPECNASRFIKDQAYDIKGTLIEAFTSASLKLGVRVSEFDLAEDVFSFCIEYKINTDPTRVINSLKATSSRAIGKTVKVSQFWANGYTYCSLNSI